MTKNKTLSSTASLFAFFILFFPALTKADMVVKKIKRTESIAKGLTQSTKDEEVITWITKDKVREDVANISTIIRLDLNKIYIIDHYKKTYSEIDLPVEFDKVFPPEAKQMMELIQLSSKSITDTGETQSIKGWMCKKFLVEVEISMMAMNIPMKMEIWASKDLGIDVNAHRKFSNAVLSLNPFAKDLSEEFKKIDGYPVLTTSSMTMADTETKEREEVISVKEKEAPFGTYSLPKDYEKIPYNPFEQ